ncbi:hypothetical protein [Propioniferax innocua]|uniref:Asparagine synthase (Glutamine-hydrolysing) n=1 Tax=Propioniferax innocua TaxID=1753 RepID=A0A542ZD50_9ACTN|nr:hypothetical protein [Propioniferax innocua]TQL58283.1 hypothetical protein FB460_2143 [Propioniferax innocua]
MTTSSTPSRLTPTIVATPGQRTMTTVISGEAPVQIGRRYFWLDGSVVLYGRAVLDTQGLATVLPSGVGSWDIARLAKWWADGARDVGALYVWDESQDWAACLPDPLGGALAFHMNHTGLQAVSTDVQGLVDYARDAGAPLQKSPLFQAERILFGNGSLVHSSYEDVEVADPFEFIYVRHGAVMVRPYEHAFDLADWPLTDLFEATRQDLLTNVAALHQSPSDFRITHLTGGFDSRLVFGAIHELGLDDSFLYFCSGPPATRDRIVSDGLFRQFGLRRAESAGLSSAGSRNIAEMLLGPMFNSAGMMETGPNGREGSVSVTALGGGYGEVLRTFYGDRQWSKDGRTIDAQLVDENFMPKGTGVTRESARKHLHDRLVARLTGLLPKFDVDFLGDAYYTYSRNRYHIGQGSLIWSRIGARFDPLYSVAGFFLASRLTQKGRRSNVVGHDLMESFEPRLLQYPFDKERFNDDLLALRKRRPVRDLPTEGEITSVPTAVPGIVAEGPAAELMQELDILPTDSSPEARKAATDKANAMRMNFWQIYNLEPARALLRVAIERVQDNADVQQVFDLDQLRQIANTKEPRKPQIRNIYSGLSSILWLAVD